VDPQQLDAVCRETPQTALNRLHQGLAAIAGRLKTGFLTSAQTEFCGEHDIVSFGRNQLANEDLRLAALIDVGGVYKLPPAAR